MIRGIAEHLLPVARTLIKENKDGKYKEIFENSGKLSIKEIYENYTAAFGMTVNQSGFQSAFAIYNESNTNSEGKKNIVTHLLFDMLSDSDFKRNYAKIIMEENYDECKEQIIDGNHNNDEYEMFFKEASIALKRALRTFELVKKSNK
jgi:hypothetical protein